MHKEVNMPKGPYSTITAEWCHILWWLLGIAGEKIVGWGQSNVLLKHRVKWGEIWKQVSNLILGTQSYSYLHLKWH